MELNKIYNEDCIIYMQSFPDNSIDLIIADPPYNIGKNYGNKTDKQSKEEYLRFVHDFIEQSQRILKETGSLILYTGKQYYPYWHIEVEKYMKIINQIIWKYDSSGVQPKNKYGGVYEPIIYAAMDDKKRTFNKEHCMVEAKTGAKRGLIDYRKNPPQPYNTKKIDGDVWEFVRVRYKMSEYTNHPTQKPLSICDRIVKVHSNVNDLVYIPFAGSGSEIESCIRNNRNWIATELNREYIDKIILPRINDL